MANTTKPILLKECILCPKLHGYVVYIECMGCEFMESVNFVGNKHTSVNCLFEEEGEII